MILNQKEVLSRQIDLLEKIRNIHKKMQEDIEIKEGIDQFKIYAKSYILQVGSDSI